MSFENLADAVAANDEITSQTDVDSIPSADDASVDTPAGGGGKGAVEDSGISEELADLARFHELDPADFSSAKQLERAVTRLDRVYAARMKEGWQSQSGQQPGGPKPQQKQPPAEFKPWEHGLKPLTGDLIDDSLAKFSESLVASMNALQERINRYEQQFGELTPVGEKVSLFEQYMQQKSAEEYTNRMDEAFAGLGKEWEELFGKGAMADLPAYSTARQKRDALAMELAAIQQGDAQFGRRQTFKQQFDRALRAAFGDHLPKIERSKLAKQAHERKNGALVPPASKRPPGPSDEAQVLARLKEWKSRVDA